MRMTHRPFIHRCMQQLRARVVPGVAWCVLCAALSGCAAQWRVVDAPAGNAAAAPASATLGIQQIGTAPTQGITEVTEADLQAGDILMSASSNLNSLGIRLFSFSAVSHAQIYLGDGQVAEALGSGVRIVSLDEALRDSNLMAAYRRPDLTEADAQGLRHYAQQHSGARYNFAGIVRHMPYTITRKVCELPVMPRFIRNPCLHLMALVQVGSGEDERFFCSQFVVEAFNHIGKPLTRVPPRWVNPSDLLHMRTGDIAAIPTVVPLTYVGHLRCTPSPWNLTCHRAGALPAVPQRVPD